MYRTLRAHKKDAGAMSTVALLGAGAFALFALGLLAAVMFLYRPTTPVRSDAAAPGYTPEEKARILRSLNSAPAPDSSGIPASTVYSAQEVEQHSQVLQGVSSSGSSSGESAGTQTDDSAKLDILKSLHQ
jgi:hypothetical protein